MITDYLSACKDTFDGVCSNFAFFKFHMIKHCPQQIKMFGSLLVMCGNRWIYHCNVPSDITDVPLHSHIAPQVRGDSQVLRQDDVRNDCKENKEP